MFRTRNILYIKEYQELPGHEPKARYMIVIHNNGGNSIYLSTTTSQLKLPSYHQGKHGCIDDQTNGIHCFKIPKDVVVGQTNNFSFALDSYVYVANDVFFKNSMHMSKKYGDVGLIEIKDQMHESIFGELVYCIYKNIHLKRGIKRELETILESIFNK